MSGIEIAVIAGTAITLGEAALAAGTIAAAVGTAVATTQQAAVADYNAEVAERNAEITMELAEADADRQRRAARRIRGKQVAAFAASGIDPTQGTPLDLIEDDAEEAFLDETIIRYRGQLASNNYLSQAAGFRFESKNLRSSLPFNVGSTVLTGGTRAFAFRTGPRIGGGRSSVPQGGGGGVGRPLSLA